MDRITIMDYFKIISSHISLPPPPISTDMKANVEQICFIEPEIYKVDVKAGVRRMSKIEFGKVKDATLGQCCQEDEKLGRWKGRRPSGNLSPIYFPFPQILGCAVIL